MSNLQVTGMLQCTPLTSTDGTFPAGSESTPLYLNPQPKPAPVNTGFKTRNIQSPSSYAAISGVGTDDDVTQGNFLYLRTKTPMLMRLTVKDPAATTTVIADIPVSGLFVMEFDLTRYLVGLEIKGAGVIEVFISGNL